MARIFLAKDNWFRNNDGSATIEFSLVLIPFLSSLLFIMELCRVMYLSAAIDLVVAESGRYVSLEPSVTDYTGRFNRMLNDNIVLWPLLSSGQPVYVSVYHCEKVLDLIDKGGRCSSDDTSSKKVLAVYSIAYKYKPLFFIFSKGHFDSLLSRDVIFVQEAKRG